MYYTTLQTISGVEPAEWDRLNRGGYPFMRHAFLHGLEQSGCANADTGWQPQHALIHADPGRTRLLGAAPLYLKHHSWGEYVFDWAWADAYERAGLPYYPKLLCAIPFTPAPGPRLLVSPEAEAPAAVRQALISGIIQHAEALGISSVHWLFTDADDTRTLENHKLLKRTGNQFHWRRRGCADFDDYLASLTAKRRKQVRRERRQVAEAGLSVRMIEGTELDEGHWDAMFGFYRSTVRERGAIPYLTRELFAHVAEHMAADTVMAVARDAGGALMAGALYFKGRDTLYGRYWGASKFHEGLHFEACYYQPIEYCLRHGIPRFEAGAQGEHKLSRGLLPTPTHSAHWLADHRFADAVREFVSLEARQVERYATVLDRHSPFRRGS